MGHAVEERLERVERLLLHTIQQRGNGVPVGKEPGAEERLLAAKERHDLDLGALTESVSRQAPPSTSS